MYVFISYASADSDVAANVASVLGKLSVPYFLDDRIVWGEDIPSEVAAALARSTHLIVVVSAASANSAWVAYEIGNARGRGCVVLPYLADAGAQLPSYLGVLKYVASLEDISAYFSSSRPPRDAAPPAANAAVPGSARAASIPRLPKQFDDHQRDEFVDDCFGFISEFFEASLVALSEQNSGVTTRLKREGQGTFTAFAYRDGRRAAECLISSNSAFGRNTIVYSASADPRSGVNETLRVVDDGQDLLLKPLLAPISPGSRRDALDRQAAAEHLWGLFVSRFH